jgi:hypothetical protein
MEGERMSELLKVTLERMETQMGSLASNMKTNQEILAWMEAKTNINLNEIREEIQSEQAEMRSIVDAWIADKKACQEAMEANPEKL